MRPSRLFVVGVLALAGGGCAVIPAQHAALVPAATAPMTSFASATPVAANAAPAPGSGGFFAAMGGLLARGSSPRPVAVAPAAARAAAPAPAIALEPIPAAIPAIPAEPPYTLD